MKVTDEMVKRACKAYDLWGGSAYSDGMRAALEAAFVPFVLTDEEEFYVNAAIEHCVAQGADFTGEMLRAIVDRACGK